MNINLQGYPNIVNPRILKSVTKGTHPMAAMPYYPYTGEKSYEEGLVEARYKELCDSYARSFQVDPKNITVSDVLSNAMGNVKVAFQHEKNNREKLAALAERIVREQFNLGEDEVIFDAKIVDRGKCSLPPEINITKTIHPNFKQTTNPQELKKRTINALSQGAALKSHYIFHMYREDIDAIDKNLATYYQKAHIANDLYYYVLDDKELQYALNNGIKGDNAGYVKLEWENGKPKVIAEAITFPILIHELTKGCVSLLSVPGIQDMTQEAIDNQDYLAAELWDIRFGPTLWTKLHSLIDAEDYDVKKHILMEIFKFEAEEFNAFMALVLQAPEAAMREIKRIAKKVKGDIVDYQLNGGRGGDDYEE